MNKSLLWKNVFCSFTYVKIKPPNTVIYPGRLAVLCTNHLFSCCSSSRLFQNENKQNSPDKPVVFLWEEQPTRAIEM